MQLPPSAPAELGEGSYKAKVQTLQNMPLENLSSQRREPETGFLERRL